MNCYKKMSVYGKINENKGVIMSWKLTNVSKLTNDPWLNLYSAKYKKGDMEIDWAFCSRNDKDKLVCNNPKNVVCNTVVIAPKYYYNGEECLILCKEFRFPLNDYIYSFPAGLVESGEDLELSAIRELREEIGAEVKDIRRLTNICYNSEGMSDENVVVFEAEVTELHEQNLEDNEEITYEIVPIKELKNFMVGKVFSAKVNLYCTMCYEMYEYKNINNVDYKFIKDIDSYVSLGLKNGELQEFWAKKTSQVYAVEGREGETITTITTDGAIECTNVVKRDIDSGKCDYIVTNSFGDTYIVEYKVFNQKYTATSTPNIYEPISNPIRVVRVNEDIEFQSHTNKLFRVRRDNYLVIPYNRYIYGITKEALYENYTIIKD